MDESDGDGDGESQVARRLQARTPRARQAMRTLRPWLGTPPQVQIWCLGEEQGQTRRLGQPTSAPVSTTTSVGVILTCPVMHLESLRMLIARAAIRDLDVIQFC